MTEQAQVAWPAFSTDRAEGLTREIALEQVIEKAGDLLAGRIRGHVVVATT
ncbi:hypothetical protein [Pseudomonas sp. dw_358]|uniref:hypothetical protein n=1 Tax=Pseudomonas sp. dw_358 TaxID=2720083 RepID=UPI001BD39474|nr:hypothetical protein [Pseudomonas sp. dw_358]